MTAVSEDLDLPPGYEAVINLTLWAPWSSQPVLGFNTLDEHSLAGTWRVVAGEDGTWQFDFVPNDLILPAGTWWRIDRHISGCETLTTFISVPVSGGPFQVADLQVDPTDSTTWLGSAGNVPFVKVLEGGEYVWASGVTPTAPYNVIIFIGDLDPQTTPGGRVHDDDIWINTA